MYRHLEQKNLLPDKINFVTFKHIALTKYKEAKIMAQLQGAMRGFGVNI